jgi:hypothetical protein
MLVKNFERFIRKKSNRRSYGKGKPKKRFCYGCGQTGHFIADYPNTKDKDKNKYKREDKKKGKKKGEAHIGEEWESGNSDSSDDEKKKGAANIAIHHSSSSTMNFPDKASPPKLFPNLDSSPSLFSNILDNDYYTPTCLMAKGEKVHNSSDPSNDEYDSCDDNVEELEASLINKFGKKAFTKIKNLLKKLEKRERCLEMQGDIIVEEKQKNLTLETSLAEEKSKVEKLTLELSLANSSLEKLTKEHSLVNDQIASLKNEKSIAQTLGRKIP